MTVCRRPVPPLVLLIAIGVLLLGAAPARAAAPWTATLPLGLPPTSVAMAPDGTIVWWGLVSTTNPGGARVAVQVRPPGGPLQPVQFLSPPGVYAGSPGVGVGPDGRFVAAWSEAGTMLSEVLLPGATQFGDLRDFPAGPPAGSYRSFVGVDAAGAAQVLWTTASFNGNTLTSTQTVQVGRRPASGALTVQQLATYQATDPQMLTVYPGGLAVSDAGGAICAWTSTSTINLVSQLSGQTAYVALRGPGADFGAGTVLDSVSTNSTFGTSGSMEPPLVAMNAGGEAVVAWSSHRTTAPSPTIHKLALRAGSALGLGGEIPAATDAQAPALGGLAILPDFTIALGWLGQVAGNARPQVSVLRPSGGSSAAQTLSLTGDPGSSGPVLTGAPDGHLLAGWATSATGTGKQSVLAAAAPPGDAFGAETPVVTGAANVNSVALAASAHGDGVVSYQRLDAAAYQGEAAGFDASGPMLTPAIPSGATAGIAQAFGAQATDIWSPITSIAWDFGDGGSATGAAVSHTYGAAGRRTVTVTATDAAGNASSASGPVDVAAGATGTSGAGAGAGGADGTAPVIGPVHASRTTFAATTKPAKASAAKRKVGRGTTLSFSLSEASTLSLTLQRELRGVRRGTRCVKGAKGRRCTRVLAAGSVTRTLAAGSAQFAFDGWVRGKRLAPGSYRATLQAVDAAGNRSSTAAPRLHLVRAG